MTVLWRVQQGFLDAALHAVEADHGGFARYLHRRVGLSDAALEALTSKYLVEPLSHGPGAAPGAALASGGDALSSHAR
jgi:protein-tyrosine phosphatase